jgi:ABC-2 type transport system permease protein
MRYLRLWWRFAVIGFVHLMEYRVNFLFSVVEGVIQVLLAVLTFELVYSFTDSIAGWSQAEVLMLVGIYRVVDALISLQIAPNMSAISGYIRHGEMDFLLMRPVSSQFLVSTRLLTLPALVNAAIGLALTAYAGNLAGVRWTVAGVAAAACLLCCGLALLYCLWFFTVTFSFWLVQVDTLDQLFYGVFEAARYPVSFFKGLVRALLTFAFPVAFATTFPTQALLDGPDARLLLTGLALSALGLIGTHLFWNLAVRHYSSASS